MPDFINVNKKNPADSKWEQIRTFAAVIRTIWLLLHLFSLTADITTTTLPLREK